MRHGVSGELNRREQRNWLRRLWLAMPLALLASVSTMVFGAYPWAGWLAFAATVPVQFVAGWPFLRGAVQQARAGSANMDTLITLGTLTAFGYSTYELFPVAHCSSRRRADHCVRGAGSLFRGQIHEQGVGGDRQAFGDGRQGSLPARRRARNSRAG